MSPTDTERSATLSGQVFDEVLVPLAQARAASGAAPVFPRWHDTSVTTYFAPSPVRLMSAADFEFPGGGTPAGLVDALAAHWMAEGESALGAARGKLHAIATALQAESVQDDGSVDIFCYTLF